MIVPPAKIGKVEVRLPQALVVDILGNFVACLDIYVHLIPEMQNEAAAMIDDLITPIPVNIAHDCTRS
jgi:hypothetical protein